jgi:hypothetical protein
VDWIEQVAALEAAGASAAEIDDYLTAAAAAEVQCQKRA